MLRNVMAIAMLTAGSLAAMQADNQDTDLLNAVERGNYDTVEQLLRENVNVNRERLGETPLSQAVLYGYIDIVELLLSHDADPNFTTKDGTALHIAVDRGYPFITQKLLEHGADPNISNEFGDTPLHKAVDYGYGDIVSMLLEYNADPNKQNMKQETSLHVAMGSADKSIISLLLEYGARADMTTERGNTPLHELALKSRAGEREEIENIIALLAKKGVSLDALNMYSATPLHKAMRSGNFLVAWGLIYHGASLNVVDAGGDVPLFYATLQDRVGLKRDRLALAEMLLLNGAHPDGQQPYQHTPLIQAVSDNNISVASRLIAHGARVTQHGEQPERVSNDKQALWQELYQVAQGDTSQVQQLSSNQVLQILAGRGYHEAFKAYLTKHAKMDIMDKQKLLATMVSTNAFSLISYMLENEFISNQVKKMAFTTLSYYVAESRLNAFRKVWKLYRMIRPSFERNQSFKVSPSFIEPMGCAAVKRAEQIWKKMDDLQQLDTRRQKQQFSHVKLV